MNLIHEKFRWCFALNFCYQLFIDKPLDQKANSPTTSALNLFLEFSKFFSLNLSNACWFWIPSRSTIVLFFKNWAPGVFSFPPRPSELKRNQNVKCWTYMLWSIDSCQNKVSPDQYHRTISWAQVSVYPWKDTCFQPVASSPLSGFLFNMFSLTGASPFASAKSIYLFLDTTTSESINTSLTRKFSSKMRHPGYC